MPKKTKKQKQMASLHKKLRLLENRQVEPIKLQVKKSVDIISKFETKPLLTAPPKYFFSDLKKSLFLVVVIIGIEVGLYAVKLIK